MKIKTKIPDFNLERHYELVKSNWIPLNEPRNVYSSIALSFPLMMMNALITLGLLSICTPLPLMLSDINSGSISISIDLRHLMALIILLLLHEALHLISIPGFWKSETTSFGITPVGGFIYSEESIPKWRHICITLAPFLVISIIIPMLLVFFNLLTQFFIVLIILNSMASSVDILNLVLVATQVPKGSQITSNGPKTYWKSR